MNFVVEDGTGKTNSTSYVNLEDFRQYWLNKGTDYSATADDDIKAWLNTATEFVDSYNFNGHRISREQALEWPRWGMVHSDSWPVLSDEIPDEIKKAVMTIAVHADEIQTIDSGVQSESFGPVSKTYTGKGKSFVSVNKSLSHFIIAGNRLVRV